MATRTFTTTLALQLYAWYLDRFGPENKKALQKKNESTQIAEHGTKIADLDEKFKELSTKFDTFSVSSEAMDKTIKNKLNGVIQMILESEAKSDAAAQARLKDKTGERYRNYHETGEWNKMEKEAFEDLIKDYEAHGGENSFVHSVCKVECYTWKLVD